MVETIITTAIGVVVSGVISYFIGATRNYKKRMDATNKALMMLLQTNLTTTYFIYEPTEKIPDYVYRNWVSSRKIYEERGGNDDIHTLQKKMENWDFTKTDILN